MPYHADGVVYFDGILDMLYEMFWMNAQKRTEVGANFFYNEKNWREIFSFSLAIEIYLPFVIALSTCDTL